MTGRDQRLALQAQAQQERAERDALTEVEEAAAALQDAVGLRDEALTGMAARRAARVNPDLLPERWAAWVREMREAQSLR
jgi:uncharacterized protein involved in propanediol utilization